MAARRVLRWGAFLALTFLFVYGNGVFFHEVVPEAHFLGWAAGQGVRLLNMPGGFLRQKVLSEEELWNQPHNAKSVYWIGTGLVLFFAAGCVVGGTAHAFASIRGSGGIGSGGNVGGVGGSNGSGGACGAPAGPCGEAEGTGAAEETRRASVAPWAMVSLALALLGTVAFGHILGYAAVLTGWRVLAETGCRPGAASRKMALAGIVIGAAVLAIWAVTLQIQPPLHAFE
ncbi:MAG: hypothetical protein N3A38_05985 [Planctomycetota bacterium]|nr:hypothetical protein [Planctomycetota bacterium]